MEKEWLKGAMLRLCDGQIVSGKAHTFITRRSQKGKYRYQLRKASEPLASRLVTTYALNGTYHPVLSINRASADS